MSEGESLQQAPRTRTRGPATTRSWPCSHVRSVAWCVLAVLLATAGASAQVFYAENDDGSHEVGIQGTSFWTPGDPCSPPLGTWGGSASSAFVGDDEWGTNWFVVLSFDTQTWTDGTYRIHLDEALRTGTPFQDLGLAIVEYKGSSFRYPGRFDNPDDVEGPGYTTIGSLTEGALYSGSGIDISSQVNAFLAGSHERYLYLRFRMQICRDGESDWDTTEIATGSDSGRAYIDRELPPEIPAAERAALIALYNCTNGGGWTNNSGWLGPVGTECDWYGVTCNPARDQVVEIHLYGNNLAGVIPQELQQLIGLLDLDLMGNQLAGSIPAALGNLPALSVLHLNNNQLNGTIPPELGSLTTLLRIQLGSNSFSGTIPAEFGNLVNLYLASLHNAGLSGEVPTSLMNLVNLNDNNGLDLRWNQLYTDDPDLNAFLDAKHYGGDWASNQITTVRFDWSPTSPDSGETVLFMDNSTSSPFS